MPQEVQHSTEGIEELAKSNKKRGIWRTFLLQFQANWLALLLSVLISGTSLSIGIYNTQKINNFIQNSNSNKNTIVNENNVLGADVKKVADSINKNAEASSGSNGSFDPRNWIIEGFDKDNEGYYCNNRWGFPYWYIWSKDTYPLEFSAKVRIKIKNPGQKIPAALVLTYGEYIQSFAPEIFYRLIFFDSPGKAIRLYDNKNDSVAQEYLHEDPDYSSEMVATLSPRVPDPNGRKLNINPLLTYNASNDENGSSVTFKPKKDFQTVLSTVQLDDGTIQRQLGIGVSKGGCIKPLSVDF